jgi:hypothetical protein
MADENSDLPVEDLALEAMTAYQELCDIESEINTIESIQSAKHSISVNTEDGGGATDAAAETKKEGIKAAIVKAFDTFISWAQRMIAKIRDFFNFNHKWFKKHEKTISDGWNSPSAKIKSGVKIKAEGLRELLVEMEEANGTAEELIQYIKQASQAENVSEEELTKKLEKAEAKGETLNTVKNRMFEDISADTETPVAQIISFQDAKATVDGSLKNGGAYTVMIAKIKANGGILKTALNKKQANTNSGKAWNPDKAIIKLAKSYLVMNRKFISGFVGLYNKSVAICYKCARAAAKSKGVTEAPKEEATA